MVWTIEFNDGRTQTYDYIKEVHKDEQVYKAPLNNLSLLFSGTVTFIHTDGRQTTINGDKVKAIIIG